MSTKIAIISLIFGHVIDTSTLLIILLLSAIYFDPDLPNGMPLKQYLLNLIGEIIGRLRHWYSQLSIPIKND